MIIRKKVRTDIQKRSELSRLVYKMKRARIIPSLYIVTLPLIGDGVLEIYNYNTLIQPYFKQRYDTIKVVGISRSKSGAMELVRKIYEDVVAKDENLDVGTFLTVEQGI
ncbi:MAG: hypothetical protein IJ619_07160 [Eubacterium sp.]|nr:hypothetical protein [Eubacterium sp.]